MHYARHSEIVECHRTRVLPFSPRGWILLDLSFFWHVSPLLQLAGRFGSFRRPHHWQSGDLRWLSLLVALITFALRTG